jgi:ABC-type methionine transport system ATPase subunit
LLILPSLKIHVEISSSQATSALDAENQDHVVKAIAQMQKEQGFTIIQIAHRKFCL